MPTAREDFRIVRLERKVFGTTTPTGAGTGGAGSGSTADLLSRIATLEATLAVTPGYYEVATKPATTGYKNGDVIYVQDESMYYRLTGGQWFQLAS